MTKWLVVAGIAIAAVSSWSCRARPGKVLDHDASIADTRSSARGAPSIDDPSTRVKQSEDPSTRIKQSEQRALDRDAARVCERPTAIYRGSIAIDSKDYLQAVERGADFVDEPIANLDRGYSTATPVRLTLEYPFERPLAIVVTAPITMRRTIDAIRAGYRQMYRGTAQRDVPGMENKEVTGPYGRAFHTIHDLVIEKIDLCADNTLSIFIGS